ncbi:heat shock 70 kDa protein 12B-like [Branchiostoma floridae]|uniref:Heat shock 70 kDa protein 12B-like n=1 Tax=Branchiostoma floridae TaxID=7739 RepID=A0A9J7KZ92_BRAFL|nr:heat shock 70 kDa protein 12B-like [Branchiostoma floridae]
MAASSSQYMAVVAIDFGTTFSGFAFSFNHQEGERGILVNKAWGNEKGYQALKTPTCLLLDPKERFRSFGFEAKEEYAMLEEKGDTKYYFFDLFKMSLFKEGDDQTITKNTKLTARNGKRLRAMDVFAHALRFLKDKALQVMKERTSVEFTTADIQWVLTVPAIWQSSARQFMRDAAYQADLLSSKMPEQLIIALEPEAASLWCRELKLVDFAEETDEALVRDVIARHGTSYLVVDCGGGTVDITAHRIQPDDSIHEIYRATGGAWGGSKVDQELEVKLKDIFGENVVNRYKNSYPSDWLEIIGDFEMKKRSERSIQDLPTRVRLPTSFIDHWSAVLQKAIREEFQNKYRILVPADPEMAIVKGAVMFGDSPKIIQTRISARTYGVDACGTFKEGVHPLSKKFTTSTGRVRCRDIFEILVRMDEALRIGESKTFKFHPIEPDHTEITFDFYVTQAKNPKFVDDEGVIREGCSITVSSPDTTKGTERDIELKIKFGGTEITATAIDIESGSNVTCHVSLITKN